MNEQQKDKVYDPRKTACFLAIPYIVSPKRWGYLNEHYMELEIGGSCQRTISFEANIPKYEWRLAIRWWCRS